MSEPARRKELRQQYRESRPEAGVYRIVNTRSGKALLGASPDLASARSRFEFARSTRSPAALDPRLRPDVETFGFESLSFEVLDRLETRSETTSEEILRDLAALEELWREKLDPSLLY